MPGHYRHPDKGGWASPGQGWWSYGVRCPGEKGEAIVDTVASPLPGQVSFRYVYPDPGEKKRAEVLLEASLPVGQRHSDGRAPGPTGYYEMWANGPIYVAVVPEQVHCFPDM